jgi:hypothetical protein
MAGCLQSQRVRNRIHPSHHMFVAEHEQERILAPFYFCNRCGSHSTSRVAALHSLCIPRLMPTAALNRLRQSRHPRTGSVLQRVRALAPSLSVAPRLVPPPQPAQALKQAPSPALDTQEDEYSAEIQAAFDLGLRANFDAE